MTDPTPTPSFGQRAWEAIKAFFIGLWTYIKAFFAAAWTFFRWLSPKTIGWILVVVVILVAVVAVSVGFKGLQIGGILGWLLGKKSTDGGSVIDIADSVDPKRVGPDGKIIPIGTPDSKGDTQAVVVPIQDPGLFSDPKKVIFTSPGSTTSTEITLPDGVTNSNVSQVIIIKPEILAVTVKDNSGISTQTVDDLLKKYGG
jgi:hypothetical protein